MSSFVHQHIHNKKKDVSIIEDIDSSDDELDSILQYRDSQPSIFPVPPRKKTASKIVLVEFSALNPAQRIRQEAIDLAVVAANEEKKRKESRVAKRAKK